MKKLVLLLLLTKALCVFSQTQHINQLIDDVLPNFVNNYKNTHDIDLVVINNEMPYRTVPSWTLKTKKYVDGKVNGGLDDGYYCSIPSIYLVSKDTLTMQFFLCDANKKFPGLRIGDTIIFYFVYQEQSGKWVYVNSISSHATWYRTGKFVGDFVKESMEECFMEIEKNDSISHPNVYVIDDYLTLFVIEDSILPDSPHIPNGHKIKNYCKSNDWVLGFLEISFYNDTIAVSSKAYKAKDNKNDSKINNYLQCSLFYHYNTNTQLWEICKKEKVYCSHNKRKN